MAASQSGCGNYKRYYSFVGWSQEYVILGYDCRETVCSKYVPLETIYISKHRSDGCCPPSIRHVDFLQIKSVLWPTTSLLVPIMTSSWDTKKLIIDFLFTLIISIKFYIICYLYLSGFIKQRKKL